MRAASFTGQLSDTAVALGQDWWENTFIQSHYEGSIPTL